MRVTLEVNGQKFEVYGETLALRMIEWRETMRKLPETKVYLRIEGGYQWWKKIMLATGHDPDKIDPAVPEEWSRAHNREAACWSYENNKIMGEPIFYRDVYDQLDRDIVAEFWKFIDNLEVE